MKVILNTMTNFEGQPLKPGDEIDIPLNISQRWINKGIAHLPEEIPFSDFVPNKKEQKIIDEYVEKIEKPIEPEILEVETEFDEFEAMPEQYDYSKTYKPKKKSKKDK